MEYYIYIFAFSLLFLFLNIHNIKVWTLKTYVHEEVLFSCAGVSGSTIQLDKNGDSEGNYSVLALKEEPFTEGNFSCNYQMKPVGQFQRGDTLVSYL